MHIDIVTGKAYQLAEDKHCWIERSDYLGKCGKEAIYFEGKLIYKLKEKIKSLFKKAVNK